MRINAVLPTLITFLVPVLAQAFPTWIGVYGSYTRHNGQNPGVFTVLMNQDYAAMRAEVGIRVGSGPWTTYPLARAGTVDVNTIWRYKHPQPFPAGATVEYYFRGYDGSTSKWDNQNGSNYRFTAAAPSPVLWGGAVYHWPLSGQIDPGDDLWVNIESWPMGTVLDARVLFTSNNWTTASEALLEHDGYSGNNDKWHLNLGRFLATNRIQYAFRLKGSDNKVLWVNVGGANYQAVVNPAPPVQWMGNVSHWPMGAALVSSSDFWVNAETWPTGGVSSMRVTYGFGGGNWFTDDLRLAGKRGNNDWWHLNLGALPPGKTIFYRMEAVDAHGRTFVQPAEGWTRAQVAGSSADTDADGLPDDWEMYWFRTLLANGADNPDNDGLPGMPFDNHVEWALGIEPMMSNRQDRLPLVWKPGVPFRNSALTFSYATSPDVPTNMSYQVYFGENGWRNQSTSGTLASNAARGRHEATILTSLVATQLDVVVRDSLLGWDNNRGADWRVPVRTNWTLQIDSDFDLMPDWWELGNGLNAFDSSDVSLDGDGDGLRANEEFAAGSDPRNADTDGDGLKDGPEAKSYHTSPIKADTDGDGLDDGMELFDTNTDPLMPDHVAFATMQRLHAADFVHSSSNWVRSASEAYCEDGRGYVEYDLVTTTPDSFRLKIDGADNAFGDATNTFRLALTLDGQPLGTYSLRSANASSGSATAYTPWLKPGTHRLRIFWDNVSWEQSLRLSSIELQSPQLPDANANGVKDWVESRLRRDNGVPKNLVQSYVSPACVEGWSRYVHLQSFPGQTASAIPAEGRGWFADVEVDSGISTPVPISFENGGLLTTVTVEWVAYDIAMEKELSIPARRTLAMKASPLPGFAGSIDIEVVAGNSTAKYANASAIVRHYFQSPGTYQLVARYRFVNGAVTTKKAVLNVIDGRFGYSPYILVNRPTLWSHSDLGAATVVSSPGLSLRDLMVPSTSNSPVRTFEVSLGDPETFSVVARAGTNGPVCSSAPVQGLRIYRTSDTYMKTISVDAQGNQLIETAVVVKSARPVPQLRITLQVITAGVTFDDGTLSKELTASDINELGVARIRLRIAPSVDTSVCHILRAYQYGIFLGP